MDKNIKLLEKNIRMILDNIRYYQLLGDEDSPGCRQMMSELIHSSEMKDTLERRMNEKNYQQKMFYKRNKKSA